MGFRSSVTNGESLLENEVDEDLNPVGEEGDSTIGVCESKVRRREHSHGKGCAGGDFRREGVLLSSDPLYDLCGADLVLSARSSPARPDIALHGLRW